MLFVGPPGLGKTTLAQIVARELGVNFRSTSGPVIAKGGDLAAQLTALEERDVLFIDEIHRLNPAVEEILYPAMEDFQLDLMVGTGPGARSVKIDLAKFTLVGATTRAGLLTTPLRDRFGIPVRLDFYTVAGTRNDRPPRRAFARHRNHRRRRQRDRQTRARHAARRRTPAAPGARFRRGRAPRNRASPAPSPTAPCRRSMSMPSASIRWTGAISASSPSSFGGGPVGIETLAAALSEPRDAIEDIIEPYLIQQGFLQRTPRGRVLTPRAFGHLGLDAPARPQQFGLFMQGDEPE